MASSTISAHFSKRCLRCFHSLSRQKLIQNRIPCLIINQTNLLMDGRHTHVKTYTGSGSSYMNTVKPSVPYIHNAALRIPRYDGEEIQEDRSTTDTQQPNGVAGTHTITIMEPQDYAPAAVIARLAQASQWKESHHWDPQFCAHAVDTYQQHLHFIVSRLEQQKTSRSTMQEHPHETATAAAAAAATVSFTEIAQQIHSDSNTFTSTKELLSSSTAEKAFKTILKMNIHTSLLSKRVRELERLIGSIRLTPITNALSFRLLEANAKAGNVGRTLALLNLRKVKGYEPSTIEWEHAIRSISSAALYLRCNRNVFIAESHQPGIDNPTRWLDAILINMSARNFPLTTPLANRMLDCYAQTGRTGKAIHYFYRVTNGNSNNRESNDGEEDAETVLKQGIPQENSGESYNHKASSSLMMQRRKAKVRMKFNACPPYHKQMSEVKNRGGEVYLRNANKSLHHNNNNMSSSSSHGDSMSKLEMEKNRHWSIPLTAAFAFADSLTFGACGHKPIHLDLTSWNTLIKVCCYRGSLWRAVEILNQTMPRNGIQPDTLSYNTILSGLARVGDIVFMRELLTTMTNKEIPLDKYTIQALVDGYLNTGDISGAITILQDVFNQHQVLPPYTTHLKIIEFALGYDLLFEAKRHVYFIQQLLKWKPSDHHSDNFRKLMLLTQSNPKLSKAAIQRLFHYFGEALDDDEFVV